ncbi:MAG: tetratricopeptide repeat protein [Bacteroidetes bacterium]|nr:tetratricopeptide repeat protein [Bacteroidota bacterium]
MKKWSVIFIFIILPYILIARFNTDSLRTELKQANNDSTRVHILILLWESTAYSEPKAARDYALQALKIAKRSDNKKGMAEAYQRIAAGFTVRNLSDSANYYYQKSLMLYEDLNDPKMIGVILYNIAILYYDQGDYVKALLQTEESLKKSSEANDEHGVAVSLQLLGNINYYMGNYEDAQKYLMQGLQVIDKLGDKIRYADGLVYLASNYMALEKFRKALDNLSEAIELYIENDDRFFLPQALNNTGFIYMKMQEYDSAKYYFEQAITKAIEIENNNTLLLAYNNMGLIHKEEKQFIKARNYFQKAFDLAEKHNDQLRISMLFRNMGDLLVEESQYEKALPLYDSSIVIARDIGSKSSLENTYLSKSDAYYSIGNYKKSLEYFKLYESMKDSLFDENKTRKIEEMEARYQKEKNEKEIAIQKSEIEILSRDLELQRIRQTVLIVGLILSFLIGIYFVIHLRNKMKRNRLIREQEKLLEEEKLIIAELQRDNYEKELEIKKNELTSHALQIVQKNELLETLKKQVTDLEEQSGEESRSDFRKLRHMINGSAQSDKEWNNFNRHFEQVHQGFLSKLKADFPILSSNDLRLSAMLKLNLTSKEVAAIMNISPESVKKARYRLRKKLQLPDESDLHSFMMNMEN